MTTNTTPAPTSGPGSGDGGGTAIPQPTAADAGRTMAVNASGRVEPYPHTSAMLHEAAVRDHSIQGWTALQRCQLRGDGWAWDQMRAGEAWEDADFVLTPPPHPTAFTVDAAGRLVLVTPQ